MDEIRYLIISLQKSNAFVIWLLCLLLISWSGDSVGQNDSTQQPITEKSTYNGIKQWEAIKDCKCGLATSQLKNQTYGLLFSQQQKGDTPVYFPIDFGSVNRIAFQLDNVFYEHDKRQMRIENSEFYLPTAAQFVSLARQYNTAVDLLISTRNGLPLNPTQPVYYENETSAGEVLLLAQDIKNLLLKNKFAGVTVDLDRLFYGDLLSYRKLVSALIRELRSSPKLAKVDINIIVADQDLLSEKKFIEYLDADSAQLDQLDLKENRLLLRLLDEDRQQNSKKPLNNRLLIRTTHFEPLTSSDAIAQQCNIRSGPVLTASLRYEKGAVNSNKGRFPQANVYPLVPLSQLSKSLEQASPFCREQFIDAFVIQRGYQSLAFEGGVGDSGEINKTGFGKVEPKFNRELLQAGLKPALLSFTETISTQQTQTTWANLGFLPQLPDYQKMTLFKRLLQRYCPACCNSICPYQSTLLATNIVLLLLTFGFLVAATFNYQMHLVLMRHTLAFIIIVVLLMLAFQALVLCEPKLVEFRDMLLMVMVVITATILVYLQYKANNKARLP
ncbi:hypothetical protein [Spartinivicinus poritis]|uniref:CHASE2 domain-containing protein n=1 Tax=Spartinivicinus poritis TaxID=2994640 RepID=A0ABT5U547_9GAMM|nr:hypothetical protein [Spartinivicinus sp. A2-2]MDE1460677.1 hypothetical protein [Spartinivicinus sp. A2-2]